MMTTRNLLLTAALLTFGCGAFAQTTADQNASPQTQPAKHRGKSAAGEYGSGVGDAGKGAAGGAGKDVGGGAAKGTGKVVKGTGKIVTHPF